MAKTRSAAKPRPSAAAAATTTAKISFRSRKIVKKPPAKPLTAATVPSPAPHVLPALSSPSPGELEAALCHLRAADPMLSMFIDSTEAPTFTTPPSLPAFHSLSRSILHQQLAAAAIYASFLALLPSAAAADDAVNPAVVLALAAADLRAIGVSTASPPDSPLGTSPNPP